jgi:beta-barrel assembly-enhancing protease
VDFAHHYNEGDGQGKEYTMKRLPSICGGLFLAACLTFPALGVAGDTKPQSQNQSATDPQTSTDSQATPADSQAAPADSQAAQPAAQPAKTKTKKSKNKKKDPDEIGNRDVGKGVNFYSIEKEIAMGKQFAQELERQAKIIDDPVISEYVNRVGQNLVRNSDVKVPVIIKVLDAEEVNAMALPGGFFYVNSGLIMKAESESELAGVMAHEIAHIAARHGTRQATRGEIVNLSTIPLIFMGGWTGYGIRQAASILIPMGFLQFSRSFESEADMLGLQYLYKAGYDPTSFVDFFEKIQSDEKKKPGTMSKIFASHPPTDDRIKAAQKNIQEMLEARPEYVVTTSEFNDVKGRLLAMHNRRRVDPKDMNSNRPQLKKAPGGSTAPIDDGSGTAPTSTGDDQDERPTLKRRE